MILTGKEIQKQRELGNIVIEPFNSSQLNPNSYDFRLGPQILHYISNSLDPKIKNETSQWNINEEGFLLKSDKIYLGSTIEVMGSEHFVPIIKGKSSIARLGLFIHVTANLIDIGSINQWTLHLYAIEPIKVYSNMLIGQVTFWVPYGEINLYQGKYQGSRGPQPSKSFLDY